MSWLDDLGSVVSDTWNWLTDSKAGNTLLTLGATSLAAWTLNKVNSNVKPGNTKAPTTGGGTAAKNPTGTTNTPVSPVNGDMADTGVRLQLNASTENKVPVIYGSAWISGKLIDVRQTPDKGMMILIYALCEKTGKLNLGKGADSVITCQDVYWNDNKLLFRDNGYIVSSFVDNTGVINADCDGLVQIYFYNNGSTSPSPIVSTNAPVNAVSAYDVIGPEYGWDNTWTLDNLVFAIVTVEYNRTKGVTNVGNFKFHLQNTMKDPGDCLYDYMTNPIYGAGMDPGEVFSQ